MRKTRALTLVELLIAMALLAAFGVAALAATGASMRHLRSTNDRVRANQNARQVTSLITTELRQGISNPHPATGWLSLGLEAPTAVLLPTPDEPVATELVFNEPNVANFDPTDTNFDPGRPDNYLRVRYYLEGNEIRRAQNAYSASGAVIDEQEEVVARGNHLELEVTWLTPHVVGLRVAAEEGRYRAEYITRPFIVSP